MSKEIKSVATEGGHWYDGITGEPRYEIEAKDGTLRATTLRDARKFGYVPSVTTITGIRDKPALKAYFRKEMWKAAFTTPRRTDMTDDQHYLECCKWADEHSKLARDAGTEVHGAIELYSQGKSFKADYALHCAHVEIEMQKLDLDLRSGKSEHSFAHKDGFGGKIDWHNDKTVVDFKTKAVIDDKKLAYDQNIQLAAYAYGLGIESPRCVNIFVGVEDKKVVVHEWTPEQIAKGLRIFLACLNLWKVTNDIV